MRRRDKLRTRWADRLRPQSSHASFASTAATATPTASITFSAAASAIAAPSTTSLIATAAASVSAASSTASSIAAASTASENPAAAVAPTTPPALTSVSAAHTSPAPTHPLFPVMRLVQDPNSSEASSPRRVFVSLSSDLRLIYIKPAAIAPSSLKDFRSPDIRLALDRLQNTPTLDSVPIPSLESAVKPCVCAAAHPDGPAVRISDGSKQAILLIAVTEDERDALLRAVRLRVAPWNILRARMMDEIATARVSTASSSLLADAARGIFAGTGTEAKKALVTSMVWAKAGTVAETSIWTATFAQGIAGVAKTAEEIERLAKPLGGLTVVGCAFSIVALSARAVSLIASDNERSKELEKAEEDLREASVSLVGWLVSILGSGFRNEDGLVDRLFGVLEEFWLVSKEVEEYLLGRWVARIWGAKEVDTILAKVGSLKGQLFEVGLLKVFAGVHDQVQGHEGKINDHEGRINDLEVPSDDLFRLPTWTQIEGGVGLFAGAATCLGRLKAAVLPSKYGTPESADVDVGGTSAGPISRQLARVALTSISGEGGVGKTSTCRLLCEDDDVRTYFSKGFIVWIDVGKSATDEKVKDQVRRAVSRFGGERSAKKVLLASDLVEAVEIASEFFAEKRILVVIDNVWETPVGSTTASWAATLSKIASHAGSAVVATTRFSSLARCSGFEPLNLVRFDLTSESSPDWRVAQVLYDLLSKAPVDTRSTAVYQKNRRKALALSCGLLLGIKTIASLVRRYGDIGNNVEAVLSKIEKRAILLGDKGVGDDEKAAVGHPGLFAVMDEGLSFLDEQKSREVKSKSLLPTTGGSEAGYRLLSASYDSSSDRAFSSRYAALHMMQSSSTLISFPLLRHLWHVTTIDEVEAIVSRFVNIGLARIEGSDGRYFVLHDLQYEYCLSHGLLSIDPRAGSASQNCPSVNGHALFLSSCKSLLLSNYGEAGVKQWAQFCFDDLPSPDPTLREYLPNNLLRHMCNALSLPNLHAPAEFSSAVDFLSQEIMSVLLSYCWLLGRFKASWDRNYLLRDFHYAIKAHVLCESDVTVLRRFRKIIVLAQESDLAQSDGKFASQLVQLVLSAEAENSAPTSLFSRFTDNATKEVLGACLMPLNGCCIDADGNSFESGLLGKATISRDAVQYVSSLGDGKHFVSLSGNRKVQIHEFSDMGTVLVLKGHGEIASGYDIAVLQQRQAGSSSFVLSIANGVLLCSEIKLEEGGLLSASRHDFDGRANSSIICISASKDGKVIAIGCDDGSVCVWEPDDDSLSSFVLKSTFPSFGDGTETMWGLSVVVSGSGYFVAACSTKSSCGCLYFWRQEQRSAERVAGSTLIASEGDNFRTGSLLLSSDRTSLIYLLNAPPAYEVWNVETGELRYARVELPELTFISCAAVAGSSDGREFGLSLLVGGSGRHTSDNALVEYLIGDELQVVRRCQLLAQPVSVCSADFGNETEISSVIVGFDDGSVRLLSADAFDACRHLEQRESGIRGKRSFRPTPPPELGTVSAVAVMPNAGFVVAGHSEGKLSLWSAKDGSFQRVVDSESEICLVNCIDICAEESVAVTGHSDTTALVWKTSTWTVHCALKSHSKHAHFVAVIADMNRVVTVDPSGKLRVWDAEKSSAALSVIKEGLELNWGTNRAFVSSDGDHFIWASGGPAWRGGEKLPWQGRVTEFVEGCPVFNSDKYWQWDAMRAESKSRLSHTEATGSWKQAAARENIFCELHGFVEEVYKRWEIFSWGTRVQCASRSAGENLSDKSSIDFDNTVISIAAQWLPYSGGDCRRRAIVACELEQSHAPAIMHFIPPKV